MIQNYVIWNMRNAWIGFHSWLKPWERRIWQRDFSLAKTGISNTDIIKYINKKIFTIGVKFVTHSLATIVFTTNINYLFVK